MRSGKKTQEVLDKAKAASDLSLIPEENESMVDVDVEAEVDYDDSKDGFEFHESQTDEEDTVVAPTEINETKIVT